MTRVLSGVALAAIAVVIVWWAHPFVFFLVAEALLVLACREYAGLRRAKAAIVPFPMWCGAAALTCLAVGVSTSSVSHALSVLLIATVVCGAIAVMRWPGGDADALEGVATAMLPSLYLGLPIGTLVLLRGQHRPAGVFLLMATIMVSDTAQYYTGRAFGRRPLAATISPKKTIEGALGGFLVGSVAFAVLASSWLDRPSWPVMGRIALGVLLVAAGIAGDLFESMLKRSAGVKDSSSLIPGHGGVLDRIDALLFAAPVYFVALTYL